MFQKWTLHIEGFGKIEKASIELSPLMIFAGDNNSGKSYVMTLLWGILTLDEQFYPQEAPTTVSYRNLENWLRSKGENEFFLDEVGMGLIFHFFNEMLQGHKEELVRKTFNADIPISRVYLSDPKFTTPVRIRHLESLKKSYTVLRHSEEVLVHFPFLSEEKSGDDIANEYYKRIRFLCQTFVLNDFSYFGEGAHYLPASRTGFMLTYKSIAKSAIRQGFQFGRPVEENRMGKLTEPITKFLTDLVDLDLDPQSKFVEVADFLEAKILQGKIEKDQSPVPNYYFAPDDLGQRLSLHVTSSLVAELAPIVLFLRSNYEIQTLFIEEPEAHLHLDMQRQMARAIVRLVNEGLPVWITTHSDTMLQQINNLIKLNNHSQQDELAKQYNYEDVDFLDPDKVKVYQFDVRERKTQIRSQPLTESGFAIPTFTNSIRKLTKETIDFMENPADEEDDE